MGPPGNPARHLELRRCKLLHTYPIGSAPIFLRVVGGLRLKMLIQRLLIFAALLFTFGQVANAQTVAIRPDYSSSSCGTYMIKPASFVHNYDTNQEVAAQIHEATHSNDGKTSYQNWSVNVLPQGEVFIGCAGSVYTGPGSGPGSHNEYSITSWNFINGSNQSAMFRCDATNPSDECTFSVKQGFANFVLQPHQTNILDKNIAGAPYCVNVIKKGANPTLIWPGCWPASGGRTVKLLPQVND